MSRSPIEVAMRDALAEAISVRAPVNDALSFEVEEQVELDRARVDFVITYGLSRLVVECDGHDFHERTKDQASRDRAKDRRLQASGYMVFRFTGSDIHWNARDCAEECLDLLTSRQDEHSHEWRGAYDAGHQAGWLKAHESPEPEKAAKLRAEIDVARRAW